MPSLPFASAHAGVVAVPPVGARVWIEFEQGDPDYPIWSGCWWGSASDVPAVVLSGQPGVGQITLVTPGQHTLVISDLPGVAGGITVRTSGGARITLNDNAIVLRLQTVLHDEGATGIGHLEAVDHHDGSDGNLDPRTSQLQHFRNVGVLKKELPRVLVIFLIEGAAGNENSDGHGEVARSALKLESRERGSRSRDQGAGIKEQGSGRES